MTNGTAVTSTTAPLQGEAALSKRSRIEFIALVMSSWLLLIAMTTLVVSSFGVFSEYQQLIWCSALFGLGIGCGGGLIGISWLSRPSPRTVAVVALLLPLAIMLGILLIASSGSINDLSIEVATVIRDNSVLVFKEKFVGDEVVRQFVAPLFLYLLLILPSLFLVPIGREIHRRAASLNGRDAFIWFSVATAAAWSIGIAALLSPYFLVWLPFVFGFSILCATSRSVITCVMVLVLVAGSQCIYLTDWKGRWIGSDSLKPEFKEIVRRVYDCGNRIDIFPLMSGDSYAGLMTSLNRIPYGLNLKPGLSADESAAVVKTVSGMEGFAPGFHTLAFASTGTPDKKSALIVGPTPANLTSAALQKGFKSVTVVCRTPIDSVPLELLHIANEKVRVVNQDPYIFLKSTQEKFDAIAVTGRYSRQTINAFVPMAKDDCLYTVDAFRLMKSHLKPDGYVSVEYTELDKISGNRLASTIMRARLLFTSQYETVGGGFLICGPSSDIGRPDAVTLMQLRDRWGKSIFRDPNSINSKLQVRAELPWTLDYPFRNYPKFRVLDLGHVSAATVVTVIVFLLLRWSALGGVMFTANRPAIMSTAAAFVCIAGKASMLLAEIFGAAEPLLLIVQALVFLLFLVAVPLAVNPLRIQPWILLLAASAIVLTGFFVESGAVFASGGGPAPGVVVCVFDLLPAVLVAGALGCYLRESQESARSLSALFIGLSMGFLLNYNAIYGGITFLGVTGWVLISALLCAQGMEYVRSQSSAGGVQNVSPSAQADDSDSTSGELLRPDSKDSNSMESEPHEADSGDSALDKRSPTTGDTSEGTNKDAVQ